MKTMKTATALLVSAMTFVLLMVGSDCAGDAALDHYSAKAGRAGGLLVVMQRVAVTADFSK